MNHFLIVLQTMLIIIFILSLYISLAKHFHNKALTAGSHFYSSFKISTLIVFGSTLALVLLSYFPVAYMTYNKVVEDRSYKIVSISGTNMNSDFFGKRVSVSYLNSENALTIRTFDLPNITISASGVPSDTLTFHSAVNSVKSSFYSTLDLRRVNHAILLDEGNVQISLSENTLKRLTQ